MRAAVVIAVSVLLFGCASWDETAAPRVAQVQELPPLKCGQECQDWLDEPKARR